MIGQHIRMMVSDGIVKAGEEGVVISREPAYDTSKHGHCYAINFGMRGRWLTYDSWFEVINLEPDETEAYFV